MKLPKILFVIDVESVGLHGEGFAVGYVVIDLEGNQLDLGLFACPVNAARGNAAGFKWVGENITELPISHSAPWLVRAAFWRVWREWKEKGAALVTDCGWPVEARFLAQCVDDDPVNREWQGPYPVYELASILAVFGKDPLGENRRLETELPKHNPLCDAKQSARLLIECLDAKQSQ